MNYFNQDNQFQNIFNIIDDFSSWYEKEIEIKFPLSQMIKSFELFQLLLPNISNEKLGINYMLCILGKGMIERKKKNKEKINKLYCKTLKQFQQSSYSLNTNDQLNILKQLLSESRTLCKENKCHHYIAFTPSFCELVEVLYVGLKLNKLIILNSFPGEGKQTAIKYVSSYLGLNNRIVNIILSKETTLDDLFGK